MRTEWANCCAPIIRLPISTLGETEAVLAEDWYVEVGDDLHAEFFTVPKGTTTDGASIPRFLWRLCGRILMVPRVYAAVLHDWLYSGGPVIEHNDGEEPCNVTRKEADECYYLLLRHFGVKAWVAKVEYWALRLFCGSHWNEDMHNPDDPGDCPVPGDSIAGEGGE